MINFNYKLCVFLYCNLDLFKYKKIEILKNELPPSGEQTEHFIKDLSKGTLLPLYGSITIKFFIKK
jgi:hypothetical protein